MDGGGGGGGTKKGEGGQGGWEGRGWGDKNVEEGACGMAW